MHYTLLRILIYYLTGDWDRILFYMQFNAKKRWIYEIISRGKVILGINIQRKNIQYIKVQEENIRKNSYFS